MASDPTLPPKVVSIVATSQEIVLSFNKPMNPAGASNVKNYAVYVVDTHVPGVLDSSLGGVTRVAVNSWPLKSAVYDPATQTVTLIPKHQYPNIGFARDRDPVAAGQGLRSGKGISRTSLQV